MKRGILNLVVAGFVAAGSIGSASAETVTIGLLGSYSATTWPVLIANKKGFFAEQKIEPDVVFAPSAPSLTQQLITGSIHVIGASGCAEPLLAAEQKAPVAILRIVGAKPNMELVTKSDITSIAQLKGRKISVAQLSGITGILFEAMIAPQGLTVKDFEIFQANSSGQRLAALKSGAVDATILVPPQNFIAEQLGFKRLAKLIAFAPDVPQTCMIVNSDWAKAHSGLAKGMVTAIDKATDWIYDPKNRDEFVKTVVATAKGDPKLIEKSLDFLVELGYFAKTDTISRKAFANYMSKLRASNYLKSDLKLEQAVYPTVKLVD